VEYRIGSIQRRLAEDPEVSEQGVRVAIQDGELYLTGAVATPARKEDILRIAREEAPELPVRDGLTVFQVPAPPVADDDEADDIAVVDEIADDPS